MEKLKELKDKIYEETVKVGQIKMLSELLKF